MNHLMHLYCAGDDGDLLLGALLGDFVKGRLDAVAPGIRAGITLHRRIDSFAGTNSRFIAAKRIIDPSFGHFRAVLVDIYFDHFLACDWRERHGEPYDRYLKRMHALFHQRRDELPPELRRLYDPMFREWMPRYPGVAGIDEVLARMAARVGRENRLAEGGKELERRYRELAREYRLFMVELEEFAAGERRRLAEEIRAARQW